MSVSNSHSAYLLPVGFLLGVALVVGLFVRFYHERPQEIVQPIAFSHRKHLGEGKNANDPSKCLSCHRSVRTQTFPGLPQTSDCMTCHALTLRKVLKKHRGTLSPEMTKLADYVQTKKPIPWQSLDREFGHVFFSHRMHVTAGNIECFSCHGDMAAQSKPRPTFTRQAMASCVSCHERKHDAFGPRAYLARDCNTCHH